MKRNNNIDDTSILKFEDIVLDINSGTLSKDNNKIQLNGKELNLMELLMINKNQVLNREVIAEKEIYHAFTSFLVGMKANAENYYSIFSFDML